VAEPDVLRLEPVMNRTPLFQVHVDAGAKMGVYAGFEMPLFYPLGVKQEHLHTRENAGLFDISHMLHIEISGSDVGEFISRICPYDAMKQAVGDGKYTFLLNEDAGIIDDLIVTRLADDRFLIVANAGCADKDLAHIQSHAAEFSCEVKPLERGFLALQGPKAEAVLTELGFDVANMAFMTGTEPQANWFLSRSGYTGEDGFEIGLPVAELDALASKLSDHSDVEWIGLAARDSLRLEAGLSLYGQDLAEDITPHEAGLIWAISKEFRNGGTFVGADALARKIAEGRKRMRVGLLADGRPVRDGTTLVNGEGVEIGVVTSGGFGPTIDGPMALGLVNVADANQPIFADMRGKHVPMTRAKPPFAPHNYKR
jgi:aminomethyltransferase